MAEKKKETAKKKASKKASDEGKKKVVKKATKKPSKAPKKTVEKKIPQTMDELLAQSGEEIKGLKRGQVLEGTITEKTRRAVFVDVNAKTEGIIFDHELKDARDLVAELDVGDKISVMVAQPENDSGQIVLSLKKASLDRAWEFFEEKLKTGEAFEVLGKEINKGGLIVSARGIQGFIPASQFGSKHAGKINLLINKRVKVKPIEINREKNRLILSERAVSEAEMLAAQKEVLEKIKTGDDFEAEITAVMPFGFFVKIHVGKGKAKTFLEGLVHISEISWERVDNVAKFGKAGEKIKVKVLAIDKKSGKLNLSMKRLEADPWEKVEKDYPKEKKVKGKVTRLTPFGAFVSLEPGVEGLIHISKIPASVSLKAGQEVECFVDNVDTEGRKMSLGMVLKVKPVGYK